MFPPIFKKKKRPKKEQVVPFVKTNTGSLRSEMDRYATTRKSGWLPDPLHSNEDLNISEIQHMMEEIMNDPLDEEEVVSSSLKSSANFRPAMTKSEPKKPVGSLSIGNNNTTKSISASSTSQVRDSQEFLADEFRTRKLLKRLFEHWKKFSEKKMYRADLRQEAINTFALFILNRWRSKLKRRQIERLRLCFTSWRVNIYVCVLMISEMRGAKA